jgi:hypothetical protein
MQQDSAMSSPLKDLANAGVSVWLDYLSRPLIETVIKLALSLTSRND